MGTQSKLEKIEDFKRKVILAIDSAELKGENVNEKRDRFEDVFSGKVNILVYSSANVDSYFFYKWDCCFTETRNGTTYRAWLWG